MLEQYHGYIDQWKQNLKTDRSSFCAFLSLEFEWLKSLRSISDYLMSALPRQGLAPWSIILYGTQPSLSDIQDIWKDSYYSACQGKQDVNVCIQAAFCMIHFKHLSCLAITGRLTVKDWIRTKTWNLSMPWRRTHELKQSLKQLDFTLNTRFVRPDILTCFYSKVEDILAMVLARNKRYIGLFFLCEYSTCNWLKLS